MKLLIFSAKPYDREYFDIANKKFHFDIQYLEVPVNYKTAWLAKGYDAICAFVQDDVCHSTIDILAEMGVKYIAMRCAGTNNVCIEQAIEKNLKVVSVPKYSPYAVAEHTVALMLTLNRKIHRAYARVREGNLSLEGLLGFDMHKKTVGIIGTGKIGLAVGRILQGFGCKLLGYDDYPNKVFAEEIHMEYTDLSTLLTKADIITLHCPLTKSSKHLIDKKIIDQMKKGVMLINTSRGAVVDTEAVIEGLKSEKIGSLGLDVYEEETNLFYEDLSNRIIQDDIFARLLTLPNVVITSHQGFFTKEALIAITTTTLQNLKDLEENKFCENERLKNGT